MAANLEILAPYLPYGIEVMVQPDGWDPCTVVSLAASTVVVRTRLFNALDVDTFTGRTKLEEFDYEQLLPILRPFSALCEPLEDGTVPAIELAKILIGGSAEDEYSYELGKSEYLAGLVVLAHIEEELVYQLDLRPGWDWWLSDLLAQANHEEITVRHPAEAIDYLRRNHFALPVNGRPLLEGVDFIPKTSSAAPIDKNTAL